MPTLYVENVPKDLYEALRQRAREHGNSIAAEVISLLDDSIPTSSELAHRRQFLKRVVDMQLRKSSSGKFPSAEKMLREDRHR